MSFPSDLPLPPLRQGLEGVPIEHKEGPMFLLRDLEGLVHKTIGLTPGGMLIASLLDGKRTAADVAALFAKSTGTEIQAEQVADLAAELAGTGFLETPETNQRRQKVLQDFKDSPARKAHHMGIGYPEDAEVLARLLNSFFKDPKGPGKEPAAEPQAEPALGLIAPHIDFPRGGPCYAWAYQALSRTAPPDLIVALGVSHMSPNSPWILTKKSYETPYGPMTTDMDLYQELAKSLWYDPLEDELVHRMEHSLEFQAVWLKHLWRDKTPPWAPILCSSFERFCPDKAPSTVETVEGAIKGVGELLKKRVNQGQRILVIAGIDLAHVGPRFGDEKTPTPEAVERIETEDRACLDLALQLQADEFYLAVTKEGNWRKVCGLSALYTAMRWIKAMGGKPGSGKILNYGRADDPMGGLVSFAAGIFLRPDAVRAKEGP